MWHVLLLLSTNLTQWNTSTQRYTHWVISLRKPAASRPMCDIFFSRFFFLLLYFSMQNCRIFLQFTPSVSFSVSSTKESVQHIPCDTVSLFAYFLRAHYQWNKTSWVTSILPKVVVLLFRSSILSTRYVYRTQNKEKHTFFFVVVCLFVDIFVCGRKYMWKNRLLVIQMDKFTQARSNASCEQWIRLDFLFVCDASK